MIGRTKGAILAEIAALAGVDRTGYTGPRPTTRLMAGIGRNPGLLAPWRPDRFYRATNWRTGDGVMWPTLADTLRLALLSSTFSATNSVL
jgi:hypothetical protein